MHAIIRWRMSNGNFRTKMMKSAVEMSKDEKKTRTTRRDDDILVIILMALTNNWNKMRIWKNWYFGKKSFPRLKTVLQLNVWIRYNKQSADINIELSFVNTKRSSLPHSQDNRVSFILPGQKTAAWRKRWIVYAHTLYRLHQHFSEMSHLALFFFSSISLLLVLLPTLRPSTIDVWLYGVGVCQTTALTNHSHVNGLLFAQFGEFFSNAIWTYF